MTTTSSLRSMARPLSVCHECEKDRAVRGGVEPARSTSGTTAWLRPRAQWTPRRSSWAGVSGSGWAPAWPGAQRSWCRRAEVRAREAVRAAELAADGRLLRLWRPPVEPGEWRTIGLFVDVDADALGITLASMPLHI